jgi:hypothetical protein
VPTGIGESKNTTQKKEVLFCQKAVRQAQDASRFQRLTTGNISPKLLFLGGLSRNTGNLIYGA